MKTFKVTLVFAVIVYAMIGIAWILGGVNDEQAMEYAGKLIAVVVIFGVALAAIGQVTSGKKSSSSETKKQGPNF